MEDLILLTGPSGSGLSSAEFVFEELGYYVVKNIPVDAIDSALDSFIKSKFEKACFILPARSSPRALKVLQNRKLDFRLIILNTSKEILLQRFALTRHVHPRTIVEKISPEEAIIEDVNDIMSIIPEAHLYIDNTSLTVKQLRARLFEFLKDEDKNKTSITFISFGIKNGIPQGIDTLLDVRLIPNPYWVEELKEMTGEDQRVIDYMMSFPVTQEILDNLTNYLSTYFKELQATGRSSYTVGVACSGGQHRSTFVANYLKEYFKEQYRTQVLHRDCQRLNKDV